MSGLDSYPFLFNILNSFKYNRLSPLYCRVVSYYFIVIIIISEKTQIYHQTLSKRLIYIIRYKFDISISFVFEKRLIHVIICKLKILSVSQNYSIRLINYDSVTLLIKLFFKMKKVQRLKYVIEL